MRNGNKNILIIMGRYLPGYKDGGPVRTVKNLIDLLGEEYNFSIVTSDRDHGDKAPYPGIKYNEWNYVNNTKVYYLPPKGFKFKTLLSLSNEADIVYVCGCFNDYSIKTLILKWCNFIKKPVVVAAMGLFSPREFKMKFFKKKLFTLLFNSLGLFNNIYWSASSTMELEEIKQHIRLKNNYFIAEDLPRKIVKRSIEKDKENNHLRVVWISRITKKKNLIGAIKILKNVKASIVFTIYGPIHNEDYWEMCKMELLKLPPNIQWTYEGVVDSEKVVNTLYKHHLFLFPTFGENYGHVIQEALSAGCICLLSDQTPWGKIEGSNTRNVLNVEDTSGFTKRVEMYAKMTKHEFQKESIRVYNNEISRYSKKIKNSGYKDIFDSNFL